MPVVFSDYPTFKAQLSGLLGIQVYYNLDDPGGLTILAAQSSLRETLIYRGDKPASFSVDFPMAVLATGLVY